MNNILVKREYRRSEKGSISSALNSDVPKKHVALACDILSPSQKDRCFFLKEIVFDRSFYLIFMYIIRQIKYY